MDDVIEAMARELARRKISEIEAKASARAEELVREHLERMRRGAAADADPSPQPASPPEATSQAEPVAPPVAREREAEQEGAEPAGAVPSEELAIAVAEWVEASAAPFFGRGPDLLAAVGPWIAAHRPAVAVPASNRGFGRVVRELGRMCAALGSDVRIVPDGTRLARPFWLSAPRGYRFGSQDPRSLVAELVYLCGSAAEACREAGAAINSDMLGAHPIPASIERARAARDRLLAARGLAPEAKSQEVSPEAAPVQPAREPDAPAEPDPRVADLGLLRAWCRAHGPVAVVGGARSGAADGRLAQVSGASGGRAEWLTIDHDHHREAGRLAQRVRERRVGALVLLEGCAGHAQLGPLRLAAREAGVPVAFGKTGSTMQLVWAMRQLEQALRSSAGGGK